MPVRFEWTTKDAAVWAQLWELARSGFDRDEDLAVLLGVSRSTVSQWASGKHTGPWPLLRVALREAARRNPDRASLFVERLAGALLDLRGQWVPEEHDEGDHSGLGVADRGMRLIGAVVDMAKGGAGGAERASRLMGDVVAFRKLAAT